ncbi:hypothetical protein FKM82_001507 [Ascaphus truei]
MGAGPTLEAARNSTGEIGLLQEGKAGVRYPCVELSALGLPNNLGVGDNCPSSPPLSAALIPEHWSAAQTVIPLTLRPPQCLLQEPPCRSRHLARTN